MRLLFFLCVGVAAAVVLASLRPEVALSPGQRVPFTIATGESVEGIAERLEEQELVRSALLFRVVVTWRGWSRELRAGNYILTAGQSMEEIAQILREGRERDEKVTIPEGFTVAEIDELLVTKRFAAAGEITACAREGCDFSSFGFLPPLPRRRGTSPPPGVGSRLEGYLFPDTYYVAVREFTPQGFLTRPLRTFQERIVEGLAEELRHSGRSPHMVITMASLIEEETRIERERNIVAGILWKRLDAGMGLDVDATLRYALGKRSSPLTAADLEIDSPYNTRRYRGLPPGPIANPGLSSIRAALHPEESPYWYYLHDASGRIHYARTNDEHNENKRKHLR